jgi:tRNA pseudouridine65 synthase
MTSAPPTAMDILYHDDDLVIVNKPSGMLVHRGWANDRIVAMTEVRNALGRWVYPVHRLDRGASGALAFALSSEAASAVCAAFAEGSVHKRYVALVRGIPDEHSIIDHAIPKSPGGPRVDAVTELELLGTFERYGWVAAIPRTGRLHQIRRHLKHISCPIIGDVRYGKGEHNRLFRDRFGLHRLSLHCCELTVPHPRTGEPVRGRAPLPPDLAEPLTEMGLSAPADAGR